MNYRTATLDQLRQERVRLTNQQRMLQQRLQSAGASRGGRTASYGRSASNHQLEHELERLAEQITKLEAEFAWRDQHAQPAEQPPTDADASTASASAEG